MKNAPNNVLQLFRHLTPVSGFMGALGGTERSQSGVLGCAEVLAWVVRVCWGVDENGATEAEMSLERECATVSHGSPTGCRPLNCGFAVMQAVVSNVFPF